MQGSWRQLPSLLVGNRKNISTPWSQTRVSSKSITLELQILSLAKERLASYFLIRCLKNWANKYSYLDSVARVESDSRILRRIWLVSSDVWGLWEYKKWCSLLMQRFGNQVICYNSSWKRPCSSVMCKERICGDSHFTPVSTFLERHRKK